MQVTPQRSPSEEIQAWARAELAPWRAAGPYDAAELAAKLRARALGRPSLYVYTFTDHGVTMDDRSASHYAREESVQGVYLGRGRYYYRLFSEVAKRFPIAAGTVLAIDVNDHPSADEGVPVFAFQRHVSWRQLLLPDVDMLQYDYFLDKQYDDPVAADEKAPAAVFVGSTTGGMNDEDSVRRLALPRLRAAVRFRDTPQVDFRIGRLVQCANPATEQMIRDLGVMAPFTGWPEQFAYRFLLSMDGNGATCSRVYVALKSRSALVKYNSDYELFFFKGLEPGRLFYAVDTDEQVLELVDGPQGDAAAVAQVSAAARAFVQSHLTRVAVMSYVGHLLSGYAQMIRGDAAAEAPAAEPVLLDAIGHFADGKRKRALVGDWLGVQGRYAAPLHAIRLEPGPGLAASDVRCQAVRSDGTLGEARIGHQLCEVGGDPLRGVVLNFEGEALRAQRLGYEGAFQDGSVSGVVEAGAACRAASGAPLSALRIVAGAGPAVRPPVAGFSLRHLFGGRRS